MEINAYNSERFERSKWRYVIFSSIFASVFILSILYKNIVWAILLFLLLWAYFYFSINSWQLTKIKISETGITIWTRNFNLTSFKWYVLEIDKKTQTLKNIVFVSNKWNSIHTFKDKPENIKNFIVTLSDYIPMLEDFEQTFFEKLSRNLQL